MSVFFTRGKLQILLKLYFNFQLISNYLYIPLLLNSVFFWNTQDLG